VRGHSREKRKKKGKKTSAGVRRVVEGLSVGQTSRQDRRGVCDCHAEKACCIKTRSTRLNWGENKTRPIRIKRDLRGEHCRWSFWKRTKDSLSGPCKRGGSQKGLSTGKVKETSAKPDEKKTNKRKTTSIRSFRGKPDGGDGSTRTHVKK